MYNLYTLCLDLRETLPEHIYGHIHTQRFRVSQYVKTRRKSVTSELFMLYEIYKSLISLGVM